MLTALTGLRREDPDYMSEKRRLTLYAQGYAESSKNISQRLRPCVPMVLDLVIRFRVDYMIHLTEFHEENAAPTKKQNGPPTKTRGRTGFLACMLAHTE